MQTVTYRLKITKPDSADELFGFESASPFGPMSEGDLVAVDAERTPATIRRITHMFSTAKTGSVTQTTLVSLSRNRRKGEVEDPAIAEPEPVRDEMASTDEFGS
jgi:hypothetical protein